MKCYRSHTYAITTASSMGKKNHVGIMPVENVHQSTIRSPNFVFNRTIISDRIAWPAAASQATTYL
ncbi:putative G-protein coupled receptor 19 [Mactra antiquata]